MKGSELTNEVQKVIYNIDDFYPSPNWFTTTTKKLAENALKEAKLYNADTFEEQWGNMFGFTFVGGETGPYWTDNPTGVSATKPNEFVSIRKSDYKTGKKIWSDFSDPALWSSYGKSTRTIMVYCNMVGDKTPAAPTGGWWSDTDKTLYNSEKDKTSYKYNVLSDEERNKIPSDIYSKTDKENIGYWQDDDNDVHDTITWVATGTFDEGGTNLDWSSPHRITGAKGEKGADGSDIQFIYALSDDNPAYPDTDTNRNNLFEAVENPLNAGTYISGIVVYQKETDIPPTPTDLYAVVDKKYVHYYGTNWYDRAQVISTEHRTEYCASRSLAKGSTTWIPDKEPFIWAHWGEDGTDGDGVEYIFIVKNVESYPDDTESKANWNSNWSFLNSTDTSDDILVKKVVYSMGDFYPNTSWFNSDNKNKVSDEVVKQGIILLEQFNTIWDRHVGKNKDYFGFNLGWTDNPENISATNRYQYVSIRKTVDGKWGAFSYPKLWSKYNLTTFKAFAFTSTSVTAELGNLTFPSGISGTIDNPLPKDTTYKWTDGPEPTKDKPQVWMTSATIREDNLGNTTWATPQRMTDTAEFQVEWSSDDITGSELSIKISELANAKYNFGNYFKDGITEANAEENWRDAVKKDPNLLLTFGDSSDNAILMATCHKSNGKWSNWELVRVKGEKGDAGTSINMKTPITYEVYLTDNNYTIAAAKSKFNAEKSKLTPAPTEGNLAIVYPKNPGDNGIYNGDPTLGYALYMCKYTNSDWVEYWNSEQVSETTGDTHPSPNGHLILWDGDSWMDVGNIVGPAGPVSEILVKYAKDSDNPDPKIKYEFVLDNQPYTAKYVGFITYPEGSTPNAIKDPNDEAWHWQLFKGQDGFGYEYIFKATAANTPATNIPDIPTGDWNSTPNVVPTESGWYDEPMEPTKDLKYVWMCWRKYDHSTQKWTNFQGNSSVPRKARLWQVYANSIAGITEYFHADSSIRPVHVPDYFTMKEPNPEDENYNDWHRFWKSYDSINPSGNNGETATKEDETYGETYNIWGKFNKYIFNREVITYSDGTKDTIDAHFLAVWEDGIKDMVDYYCLDSVDDGSAPAMMNINNSKIPITDAPSQDSRPGKDYWVLGTSIPKMDKDWPVLWNVTKKTYLNPAGNEDLVTWTTPLVLGVFGEGENGQDSIYADLDNEMDTVQIDSNKHVIRTGEYSTILHMYQGSKQIKIHKITISGEDSSSNPLAKKMTLSYKNERGEYIEFNENDDINNSIITIFISDISFFKLTNSEYENSQQQNILLLSVIN